MREKFRTSFFVIRSFLLALAPAWTRFTSFMTSFEIHFTRTLAAKIPGVRALDGGKLENARVLEQITALLIGLNIRHKGHSGIRITGLPPEAYR